MPSPVGKTRYGSNPARFLAGNNFLKSFRILAHEFRGLQQKSRRGPQRGRRTERSSHRMLGPYGSEGVCPL